ncbi:HpcH/HpaI aldolase family protein [Paraburkholderia xenovorans]|jgi:2-keto-3-deoxy-L-rhamnonate aldolase RhmA
MTKRPSFRDRLRERQRLLGTFVKTNAFQLIEVLGTTGLDFIVIDAEHAPFDRSGLDTLMLAARSSSLPALVRIPGSSPDVILGVLDLGGTGLLVPHVRSASDAGRVLASTRYTGNGRGFSNSTRAGHYGKLGMSELVTVADRETVVIAQIEDREAVECIDSIIAVRELDCLFIGRADLAVSYGVLDIYHPVVTDAVMKVCQQCHAAGKPLGIFLADGRDIEYYEKLGVTLFVIGSDQSFLRAHATTLREDFQDLKA